MKNMTKEEIIRKAELLKEDDEVREFNFHHYTINSPDALSVEALNTCDNLRNFTLEFIDLLDKYNIEFYSVNGMLNTFITEDNEIKHGIGIATIEHMRYSTIEELEQMVEKDRLKHEEKKNQSAIAKESYEPLDEDDYEDYDEDDEECEYSASAVFTADIEYDFTTKDQEIDKRKIFRKVEKHLDDANVYIEDYDEDSIEIEHIKDNEYKLILKDVQFSTGVTVTGYSFDQCNDDRWGAFQDKVDGIECLTNVRDEDVSEVD